MFIRCTTQRIVDLLHRGPHRLIYAAIFGVMADQFLELAVFGSGAFCEFTDSPYQAAVCNVGKLFLDVDINPRRACAARVTVVVLCVCVCVRGPHLQLAQLSDKVGILAVSVSCSLVFKKGVFRTIAFWRS